MPEAIKNKVPFCAIWYVLHCIVASSIVCTAAGGLEHAPDVSSGVNTSCINGNCSVNAAEAKGPIRNVSVYQSKGKERLALDEPRFLAKRTFNYSAPTCNIKPLIFISFPMLCTKAKNITGELELDARLQAALRTPCDMPAGPITVLLLLLMSISRYTLSSRQDSDDDSGAGADASDRADAGDHAQLSTPFRVPEQNRVAAFTRETFDSVTACWHTAPPIRLQNIQLAFFALLMIQLHAFAIPETYAFSLPEEIENAGIHAKGMSFWTEYLLPGTNRQNLSPLTATSQHWREQLNLERWGVTVFIAIYLILPALPRQRWMQYLSLASFMAGTLLLAHLTGIAALLLKSHTNAPLFQILVGALIAMPSMQLGTTPAERQRAGAWLHNGSFFCIVVPTYLSSGMSKTRYEGPLSLLNGAYAYKQFKDATRRQHAPLHGAGVADLLITSVPGSMHSIGWFIVVFELILPSIVLVAHPKSRFFKWARLALMVIAVKFHAIAFFLFGANFCFNMLLLLLLLAAQSSTWIPLAQRLARKLAQKLVPEAYAGVDKRASSHHDLSSELMSDEKKPPTMLDRARALFCSLSMFGWFIVSVDADLSSHPRQHAILGTVWRNDKMLPFSIHSMYTSKAKKEHHPVLSFSLVVALAFWQLLRLRRR